MQEVHTLAAVLHVAQKAVALSQAVQTLLELKKPSPQLSVHWLLFKL